MGITPDPDLVQSTHLLPNDYTQQAVVPILTNFPSISCHFQTLSFQKSLGSLCWPAETHLIKDTLLIGEHSTTTGFEVI